jgi:(p)ppGpp synthase/HD superfamily hydrolase
MIQELYQKAMKYAGEKHRDQLVPGTTANYLLHISNVTMEVMMAHQAHPDFDLALAMPVAILHDTIEDTDATYEEISELYGSRIADGVLALTKDDSLPDKPSKMADSLQRIRAQAPEVALVKIADRITNLQSPPAHWTSEKITAYRQEAIIIADALGGKHDYLDQRIRKKIEAYGSYNGSEA